MQKILFYALLVLMPVQLGRHFWPDFAFVSGVRVDYLSPTLYLTDLLVLGIFLLEIVKGFPRSAARFALSLFLVAVFALANIYFSLSPFVSIYKWLKVLELVFLGWWVWKSAISLKFVAQLLLIPVLFESVLVFWQFLAQQSLGVWFLGERTFNSSTPGIANTSINSQLWLRPYGTFSHPNVLGGWLAVVLPLVIYYFPHNYRRIAALVLGIGFGALVLSLSRVAIGVGVLASGAVLILKHKTRHFFLIAILGGLFLFGLVRSETESLVVREQLNRVALVTFLDSPVLGSGLGTAPLYKSNVSNYALVHQPTHNVYLMVLGELGVLGLFVFVGFGMVIFVAKKSFLVVPLLSIAAIGFFDHYFLTLQQTQLLFAIVLGFGLKLRNEV